MEFFSILRRVGKSVREVWFRSWGIPKNDVDICTETHSIEIDDGKELMFGSLCSNLRRSKPDTQSDDKITFFVSKQSKMEISKLATTIAMSANLKLAAAHRIQTRGCLRSDSCRHSHWCDASR